MAPRPQVAGIPAATYRLQLRPEFGFAAAAGIVPYLRRLGISHLYLSPITAARSGSTHGYDVIDYNVVSPALGGEDAFVALSETARANGLGIIVDFVPNHMAASPENPWWADVLRRGMASPFAGYFDIDWRQFDGFRHKAVTLPLLDKPYDEALSEIRLGDGEIVCSGVSLPMAADTARGDPADMLAQQHYRLIPWRDAARQINYRRFFDISDLVGTNAEAAFDDMHRLLARLVREKRIDGVRLDHVDGLRDPARYCERLRRLLKDNGLAEPYLVVEKILEADEELPALPGIHGTTGYEALNLLTRLFVDETGLDRLAELWREIGPAVLAEEMRVDAKRQILRELFPGGLADLVGRLQKLDGAFERAALEAALVDYLVRLPVYRTYVDDQGASDADRKVIEGATDSDGASAFLRAAASRPGEFTARLQQFSGPVMAKAIEDTLFYRDFRLLALNEVGGGPELWPLTAQDFHAAVLRRQGRQPQGMIATATHDTKRGEDARLRLASLTFMAEDWRAAVTAFPDDPVVSPEHRYMLWQSMLGAWPLDGVDERFAERIKSFAIKALREGKQRSRWTAPDSAYEKSVEDYVDRLLTGSDSEDFRRGFVPLAERAARLGAALSLAQLVLKATLPGVPDFYQGCEFWDLSLVDPDNRREVDFDKRSAALSGASDWRVLARQWREGGIKIKVTNEVLRLRQDHLPVFQWGRYRPLTSATMDNDRTIAFAREHDGTGILVAACCNPASFVSGDWFDFSDWQSKVAKLSEADRAPLIASPALPFAVWRTGKPLGPR